MQVGPWQIESVRERSFSLDGGSMFGVVPRTAWSRLYPPDDAGRIALAARSLLARHVDGHVVVVDAGLGERWMGRAKQAYAIGAGPGLTGLLADRGLTPSDVTDVVITHLHFDHAGGLVGGGAREGLLPVYPRAQVHVQAEHLAWAESPSPHDRASFRAADFKPLRDAGLMVLHEGPGEILPDLEVRLSQGHTPAMQIPLFHGEPSLVFPSDMIPTTAHVQLPWVMAYDNRPLETVAEKEALLAEAAAKGCVVVPDHDPEVEAFTVRQRGRRFEWEAVALCYGMSAQGR
jgi:glyoxylase-like metal-dependent hydrolase (beta-lactamase superfamily II)